MKWGGFRTSEGGRGGMLSRRLTIYKTVIDLGNLNSSHPDPTSTDRLIETIDGRNINLIIESFKTARQRIASITDSELQEKNGMYNHEFIDPNSPASKEAIKYASILYLYETRAQINPLDFLNEFSEKVKFPTRYNLLSAYPAISESQESIIDFIGKTDEIVKKELGI